MHAPSTLLSFEEWQSRSQLHKQRVLAYTNPCRERRGRHEAHPVLDFLFTYYSFPMGRLEAWHPSLEEHLEIKHKIPSYFLETHYSQQGAFLYLDSHKLTEQRRSSISWMIKLLENTQQRPPIYGCYGMHEWAMVYQGQEVRHHKSAPLRLGQAATDAFVESRSILCSHYDAFRFFTPEAQPYNKLQPCRDAREDFEQPGCIHANMDIYKWAYKCMPWVGSDFLWKTFELALEMRELDMRAAPYDLTKWDYEPVKVETLKGRKEYEILQRQLAEKAKPLREELILKLQHLLS